MVIAAIQGQHSSQSSFLGMIYDKLVPPEHLLCRIAPTVDFSLISGLVRDCCHDCIIHAESGNPVQPDDNFILAIIGVNRAFKLHCEILPGIRVTRQVLGGGFLPVLPYIFAGRWRSASPGGK